MEKRGSFFVRKMIVGLVLFFGGVFASLSAVYAAIPSQITDYKPQVMETKVNGTVTNSKGETVNVTISHPGVGMTATELDSMRDHVRAGDEPWTKAFEAYANQGGCGLNPRIFYENNQDFIYVPNVWNNPSRKEYVTIRGNWDGSTAVKQAIMWYITGNDIYRGNCMKIIRLWSQIEGITPEKDFRWGITSYQLTFAAEIMKYSDCQTEEYKWTDEDDEKFNRFLDLCKGCNEYTKAFWMNQHDFVTMGILACGVFQNDFDRYAMAVEMTSVNSQGMQGGNNGSIYWQCRLMTKDEETGEAIPKEEQTVQLIEAGRDQGHTYATISALSTLVQSIYVQGTLVDPETGEISNKTDAVNLFEFQDDRFLKGVRTAIRYNLGYEDRWITADSSRGYYREPSTASWRGRINDCLGILYNYYRYVDGADMYSEELVDIAKTYERYMPELTHSNDYPLAATLFYLPDNAKDNYTETDWYPETDMVKQLENYTATLSGTASIKTEEDITYVNMTPGTEIATSTYAWPAEGGMGLRVRSDGTATVEVRRMHNTYAPKAVFQIPDTKGKWVTVTCNTAGSPYNDGNIIFYKVLGEATSVDIDYVDFASKEAADIEIRDLSSCLTETEAGETVYYVKTGKTSQFRVQTTEGSTYYYVDTKLQSYSANPADGILSITPKASEAGKTYEIWVTSKDGDFASVKKIIIRPYSTEDEIVAYYKSKYHPETAEYTIVSKVAFETALEDYKAAGAGEKLTAAKKVKEAFHGLQGLLAHYEFENADTITMTDSSGNANHGVLYKNAKKVTDNAKNSKVLNLDGSIGTYAALPTGILNDCEEFTLSFDVKPTTVSGNFFTYAIGSDIYGYTYLKTLEESLDTRITKYSSVGEESVGSNVGATAEQWMHITVVYSEGKIAVYVDNKLVGANTVTVALSDIGQNLEFWLGRSFWLWDNWFAGSYDNVKVYNYAMTKEQVGDTDDSTVTLTYIVSDGAKIIGEDVQIIKKGESASPIALYPYSGYEFLGWSDGNMSLNRADKYLLQDTTLYARFRKNVAEESLVVAYDMEETMGDIVRDVTGKGNYLMLYGNAKTVNDTARQSNVLYLDGTNGTYAELPKGLFDSMESVTIFMDVKHLTQPAINYMTFVTGIDTNKYYFIRTNDTNIKSAITTGSYGNEQTVQPTVPSMVNTWSTITAVLQDGSMVLYQDGVKIGEKTDLTLSLADLGSDLVAYLGKSLYAGDGYFKGYIDNVKVYNYAVEEEIISGAKKEEIVLSYIAGNGGSIEGVTKQNLEVGADGSTVTAVPQAGYTFVEWNDGNQNATRTDTNIQRSCVYEAVFERTGITYSKNLVADYEMSYGNGGILVNRASGVGRLDAKLVGITASDFTKDGKDSVLKLTGDATKYVELPMGLLGDNETFTIETTVKSTVKAYHWLYSIGSIVDAKNYIFLNPMSPDGTMLSAIKDNTTETRILNDVPASADMNGYNTITLTYDAGKIHIYVNGELAGSADTAYSLSGIIENGTTGDVLGYIGKSLYASDPAFNGSIKSFKVFDCALDANRIKARYEGTEKEETADVSEEKRMEYYLSFNASDVTDASLNTLDTTVIAELKKTVSYTAGYDGSGKSIFLNSSEDTQNYLQISDSAKLVPETSTISFWLKAPEGGLTEEQGIVSFAPEGLDRKMAIRAAVEQAESKKALCMNFAKNNTDTMFYTDMTTEECFAENTWVHMTVTYDGTTAKIYRNGVEIPVTKATNRADAYAEGCVIGKGKNAAEEDTFLVAGLDEVRVYNYVVSVAEIQKLAVTQNKERIAYFSFDDKESGLLGSGAKATAQGTLQFTEDGQKGKAASFDGTGSTWLQVTKTDGSSLLTGLEEATICYYSKALRGGANWTFYAAPNTNTQGNAPTYLGILDRSNEVVVERHNNGRKATATTASNGEWKHIAVVFSKTKIEVYVNGVLQGSASNSESLKQILGDNSIFYIGKANWGSGEYYQGLIDEYSVYNYALTKEDVEAVMAQKEQKQTHQIAYMAEVGGKVTGLTVQEVENGSAGEEVTAIPAEGYTFVRWSDGVTTASRKESNVTADALYTAIFKLVDEDEQERLDEVAANEVEEKIAAIGTVNTSNACKAKIDEARAAYTALTESQRLLVDNYTVLTEAESTYAVLKAKEEEEEAAKKEQEAKDAAAANAVEEKIAAIGTVDTTSACKAKIDAARIAYTALTEAQKLLVDNYTVLTNAETTYTALKAKEEEEAAKKEQEEAAKREEEEKKKQEEEAKKKAQAGTISVEETAQTIASANTDKGDVAGSKFAVFKLKAKGANKSVKLSWSKVSEAEGYMIYGSLCGKPMELIEDIPSSSKSYTVKGLSKGKYYKFMIVAYKTIYKEKRIFETSATVHVATTGGKSGNPTAVTYKKAKLTVKLNKTMKLKPTLKTKGKVKTHIAKFRYESTNPSIATVDKKGKIKGIAKGTCDIYIYSQNGFSKKIKVTVK